tara:strand:+ start:2396 stop:5131 length:2736 start_codon:yes stop_codon:yes gene_type:complete
MPYSKITLPPGINREGTQYSAEGNWFDCDLIRFRQGRPEKIGGWEKYSTNEFLGISRALLNWSSIDGSDLMAVGSGKKLYAELGGVYYDITPMRYKTTGRITADIDTAVQLATFDFDVATNDVIRMSSDANAVGDELMLVTAGAASGGNVGIERGSISTVVSAHYLNESAFLLENLSNPIRLVQNSTTALIKYDAHGLTTGDFVNFLRIDSILGVTGITRYDLFSPSFSSGITGYDTTKSTQSFPVTKMLTSGYFEIKIATAPTGLSSSLLSGAISNIDTDITLTASTPPWAAGDVVKIGSEYIELTTGGPTAFTGCLRSQFGSMSASHPDGSDVSEVGNAGIGQGGNTIIMRDIKASESTFTEFSGWGSGSWGGIPSSTVSTTLSSPLTAGAVSASVSSTESFGNAAFTGTMLIESELISYTIASNISFSPIVRGALGGGGLGVPHANGTSVFLVNQYWTGWGNPTIPFSDGSSSLNVWSIDSFGENLIAAKDRSTPYIWRTPLKMSNGFPYKTRTSVDLTYASGIMLSDAVPLSSYGAGFRDDGSVDDGYGLVPDQVGFLMSWPASRQIIAFGATDTLGFYDPMLVRWCDENAPGSWRPLPTNGNRAGGNPLQNGSRMIAAARASGGIIIWTDKSLYSMNYTSSNLVFNFSEISDSISIASRDAHRVAGGSVYWMGDNNFYVYSERGGVEDLECSVLSKVFDSLNYDKRETVTCALNSLFNEIIWFYPSSFSDEPDSYVIYNYVEQTWAYGLMARTGWSDAGLRENPNSAYSRGPYESGLYEGIERSIIYNQEVGYMDDQVKMNSYVESGFIDADDGDVSMFMDRVVPDFRSLGSLDPELTIKVSAKDYPFSSESQTSSVEATLDTEYANIRIRGRTISLRFEDNASTKIDAGWQLGDPRIRMKPDGER